VLEMEKKEMLEKIKKVNPYIANKIKNRNKKLIEEGYNLLVKKRN